MVQLDKRRLIWSLNSSSIEISSFVNKTIGGSTIIDLSKFLSTLSELGYDSRSEALADISKLALIDGHQSIDITLLFHVISEAVRKVRERNVLFWNTVMTVSSGSIAWIDFRRKLSKWLSANNVGVGQIKNIMSIVQEGLDRSGTGLVRRDEFLGFCEEILGVDCLLSPDIVFLSSMGPVRRLNPGKQPPRMVRTSPPPSTTAHAPPVVPLHRMGESTPVAKTGLNEPLLMRYEIKGMRIKSGIRMIARTLFRPSWMKLVLNPATTRQMPQPPIVHIPKVEPRKDTQNVVYMLLAIRKVRQRVIWSAWCCMTRLDHVEVVNEVHVVDDAPPAPSWTVTIQAVAVTNLYGVLRAAIARSKLCGYFTIRTGRSLDENYTMRMISWAQSKQGKNDGKVAMNEAREILAPVDENEGDPLEFDLS